MPVSLIYGKSLVGGSVTGDVFEGITATPIAYVRARGYESPAAGVSVELGGPWAFYRAFWRAHNIEHLADLYSPEAQVTRGNSLWVPLIIRNDTDRPMDVNLRSTLPQGWKQQPVATLYKVGPHDSYSVQLTITSSPASQKESWENLGWEAESNGKTIGSVRLRVEVEANGLPQ